MTPVTDGRTLDDAVDGAGELVPVELHLLGTALTALLAGAALAYGAYAGAIALLVAVAAVQAGLVLSYVLGTGMPGFRGGSLVAVMAAAGADVAVSLRPHGRLGVLLTVLGLAVAVMFVHQLIRGAGRVQLVSSLSAISLLVLGVVALPALIQLRHETAAGSLLHGDVVVAAVAASAVALVVGCLTDTVSASPRFDADVPRGLLGLLVSTGVGAALGHLLLGDSLGFTGGRAAFVGGAVGALSGLIAVAGAYVLFTTPQPGAGPAARLRPVLAALLPLCVVAPASFVLFLAVRA